MMSFSVVKTDELLSNHLDVYADGPPFSFHALGGDDRCYDLLNKTAGKGLEKMSQKLGRRILRSPLVQKFCEIFVLSADGACNHTVTL